jgi:hypothetical protein
LYSVLTGYKDSRRWSVSIQCSPSSQSICAYYVGRAESGQQRVMKFNYLPNRALTETVDVKGLDDCLEKEKIEVSFFVYVRQQETLFSPV